MNSKDDSFLNDGDLDEGDFYVRPPHRLIDDDSFKKEKKSKKKRDKENSQAPTFSRLKRIQK